MHVDPGASVSMNIDDVETKKAIGDGSLWTELTDATESSYVLTCVWTHVCRCVCIDMRGCVCIDKSIDLCIGMCMNMCVDQISI